MRGSHRDRIDVELLSPRFVPTHSVIMCHVQFRVFLPHGYQGPTISTYVSFFLKNGHSRPLFFVFFYKQLTENNCSIKVADDWIRTRVLWYRKRPLCQLRHNHFPLHFFTVKCIKTCIEKAKIRKKRPGWPIFFKKTTIN